MHIKHNSDYDVRVFPTYYSYPHESLQIKMDLENGNLFFFLKKIGRPNVDHRSILILTDFQTSM